MVQLIGPASARLQLAILATIASLCSFFPPSFEDPAASSFNVAGDSEETMLGPLRSSRGSPLLEQFERLAVEMSAVVPASYGTTTDEHTKTEMPLNRREVDLLAREKDHR